MSLLLESPFRKIRVRTPSGILHTLLLCGADCEHGVLQFLPVLVHLFIISRTLCLTVFASVNTLLRIKVCQKPFASLESLSKSQHCDGKKKMFHLLRIIHHRHSGRFYTMMLVWGRESFKDYAYCLEKLQT